MSDQICDTCVRYITHKICNKVLYIYHVYYIHALYTHTCTHRVLYVDFTHNSLECLILKQTFKLGN